MSHDTGVDVEVISGDPGHRPTQRPSVTRPVGLGAAALAEDTKDGGSNATAVLVVANAARQFVPLGLGAAKDGSRERRRQMVQSVRSLRSRRPYSSRVSVARSSGGSVRWASRPGITPANSQA